MFFVKAPRTLRSKEYCSTSQKTYSKISCEHLRKADNDERIIGNKHYSSARKVTSREKLIAWVIPVSFPYPAKASYRDFMVCWHCYY